jgi:uncharacterized protein YutE (UPF0331/DUF86 family)
LHDVICAEGALDKIQIRAARASMQILIENAIGKARRILKHLSCPLVPTRGRDALVIMHDTSLLDDHQYQSLMQAVGFRNAMIHDYMNFDEKVLVNILREKRYLEVYRFLMGEPDYSDLQRTRVANYAV